MRDRTVALLLAGLLAALLIGCGSNNTTAFNPPPNPSRASQYGAALLRPGATGSIAGGQVFVNQSGASGVGRVQATGGAANATYTITFKPFTNSNSGFQVGSVMSDATGNIDSSFTFSPKGTFAGIFHLSAGTNSFNTEIDPMNSGVDDNTNMIFNVPVVRASTVAPAISSGVAVGTDALGSGLVKAGSGKLHAELQGAAAITIYDIVECGVNASSSCQAINQPGTIATDASGNATLDQNFFTNGDPAVIFEFFNNNQLEYVTGFIVQ